jgi:hypothetical protein
MISTYHITTGMGTCFDKLPFLTDNEHKEFNSIGYSGKTLDGKRTTRLDYLNRLGKGEFDVTQTKYDDGSFEERFTIVWVR